MRLRYCGVEAEISSSAKTQVVQGPRSSTKQLATTLAPAALVQNVFVIRDARARRVLSRMLPSVGRRIA